MRNLLLLFFQLAILSAIYLVSSLFVKIMQIPIPASVLGMIILYICLVKGIIKLHYIEKAAAFLIKHLAFFFIPFAVGLMKYGGMIQTSGWKWLLMIVGSTVIGLWVTSGLTQYLSKKEMQKHERSHTV
ncbi:CidA/LrgA family protein [Gracilibacillus xinjiangensis]|uniref:CidA/LrgA family protein n=1 Tax=Gracilibacillus xinjiangensis TaxID=1193282 RepID=A0ABV8WSG3_9BACI